MTQVQPVVGHPLGGLLDSRAFLSLLRCLVDQQAFAHGRGQRVDVGDLAVGVFGLEGFEYVGHGFERAGKPAREAEVENVPSAIEDAAELRLGLVRVGERGGEDLAVAHHVVEALKVALLAFGEALELLAIAHEAERQDMDAELLDHGVCKITAGIGNDLELQSVLL